MAVLLDSPPHVVGSVSGFPFMDYPVSMTQQHLDDVFWAFAGHGHYLLDTDDLLQLLDLQDDAGRPIVRVIDSDHCEMMGAIVEPWRCDMPGLPASAHDLWIWRLGDITRPAWLPDFDLELDSLSDH